MRALPLMKFLMVLIAGSSVLQVLVMNPSLIAKYYVRKVR